MSARRAGAMLAAIATLALACLAVAGPVNAAPAKPDAVVTAGLSPIGDRAVADLRECLSSNSALDVFYLLDASGSLFKKANQAGSDPDFVRADLIANSLRQLAGLQEGLQLSYGLGFFGTSYRTAITWRSVNPDSVDAEADRLRTTIRAQKSMDWTDWLDGIDGAQQQLAVRKATTNGCQVLVWLTDGGINLDGYNDAADDAALNTLCGEKVRPGSTPAPGGAFNEMRQSGIVVFGVLLRAPGGTNEARDKEYSAYMKPLVEGEGPAGTGAITCGEHPIPSAYVAGAYLEATSASDLAQVFLSLGAVVAGGYPAPFDADGGFQIDPGISQFRIVTGDANWSLRAPDGSTIGAGSTEVGVTIDDVGGATAVRVEINDDRVGHWTWTSDDPTGDELYFYSGLRITLDTPGTFLAGADNRLTGTIDRTDQRHVPLSAYTFDLHLSIADGGTVTPIGTGAVELDEGTGDFTFHYPALEASGVVTLEADIDDLRSVPSGTELAGVASRLDVTVTLPAQYPSVSPQPLILSDLIGSGGEARGEWTVAAPRDGSEGALCFPSRNGPTVVSDVQAADRAGSWNWEVDGDFDGDGCITIGGGTVSVTVTARNEIAAYSDVAAVMPVVYRSAGDEITGSLPIAFTSTRPLDLWAFWLAVVGLLATGILLPLAILWGVNKATHKITQGRELLRSITLPVVLDGEGELTTLDGRALRDYRWDLDSVQFMGSHDSRSYTDGDLGIVKARVPLFPLNRPWYEIEAPRGRLLFGTVEFLPVRRRKREARGAIASFSGDLGKVWGFVADEQAVASRRADEDLPGTFVVWARNTEKDTGVFYGRMAEILSGEGMNTRISRATSVLGVVKSQRPRRFTWPSRFTVPWRRSPRPPAEVDPEDLQNPFESTSSSSSPRPSSSPETPSTLGHSSDSPSRSSDDDSPFTTYS